MKKEGSSWHQHISSTLEKLAASIADIFTDSSFANKLLNEVNQSEFVNVIQSLSRGIELFTKINTGKCINQPGKVYVVNIKVRCKGDHIILVKEVNLLFNFSFLILIAKISHRKPVYLLLNRDIRSSQVKVCLQYLILKIDI